MAEYRPRVADRRLEKLLRAFGAVEIVGLHLIDDLKG